MIQLKTKTEFSLRKAYGHVHDVVRHCHGSSVAITDNGTWGYVKFAKACKLENKKPIFGLTTKLARDSSDKQKLSPEITLLSKNLDGLHAAYRLGSLSWDQMYYNNRLFYSDIHKLDSNIIVIIGQGCEIEKLKNADCELYIGITPNSSQHWINEAKEYPLIPKVITSDNVYIAECDKDIYLTFISDYKKSNSEAILNECEMKAHLYYWEQEWFDNSDKIADSIEQYELPVAKNVQLNTGKSLDQMCREQIKSRVTNWTDEYEQRLVRELKLIKDKDFEDYFFIIADLIIFAKERMLVGPGRGSSAGSLVCYLLRITEVDPIEYGLIFERFIDINRDDLPDIDIDFPDDKRQSVINYLIKKYGKNCVAHIGTISQYKTRSILGEIGKKASIPFDEMNKLKDEITTIEESKDDDIYKEMLEKYPVLSIAEKIENHARHSGKHAAGIIVMNDNIQNYCSVFDKVAQIDKKDAEEINILKIDVLGLRTLSVINDCLKQTALSRNKILNIDLNDERAYRVLNSGMLAGIFQFEGDTLKNLSKKMPIERFGDIVSLTTISRPGALLSGGANTFINRRSGRESVQYPNKFVEEETKETFGVIIYQEQVMSIARTLGQLSWEDVSSLRKMISKGGNESALNSLMNKFIVGAEKNGLKAKEAQAIWEDLKTFGSYGFNKSHAVCYALISYWCAWLKANYPLEFAVSCLRNAGEEEKTIKMLRELVNEGFKYKAFDMETSQENWSIQKGVLVGGLTGIKGIGIKAAQDIIRRRKNSECLLPGQASKLADPQIFYQDVFECNTKFGEYYKNPEMFNIRSGVPVSYIKDINDEGEYIFIGKLLSKDIKNLNDYDNFKKSKDQFLFLNLIVEDDTDQIKCMIDRWKYPKYAQKVEDVGGWYLIRGIIKSSWRKIYVDNIKRIG